MTPEELEEERQRAFKLLDNDALFVDNQTDLAFGINNDVAPVVEDVAPVDIEAERQRAFKLLDQPDEVDIPDVSKGVDVADLDFSKQFSVSDLVKDESLFGVIKDVQKLRQDKEFKEGDSREDFVNEFLADQRFTDFNTYGTISELSYIKNADPEEARKSALARKVYGNTASFYEEGGQGGISPYYDIIKAIAVDPVSYLGFGVGKIATAGAARVAGTAATKELAEQGLKQVAKKAAGYGAVSEGLIGAAAAITDQNLSNTVLEKLDEEPEEVNWGVVGLVGVVSAALGGISTYAGVNKDPSKTMNLINEEIKKRQAKVADTIAQPPTKLEEIVMGPISDGMDEAVEGYMKAHGNSIVDALDPEGIITDPRVKVDYVRITAQAAYKMWQSNPAEYGKMKGERVQDVIARIITSSDALDDTAVEQGLMQLGISKNEYAGMFLASGSASGQTLNALSQFAKNVTKEDTALKKKFDELYGSEDERVGAFAKGIDFLRRIDRESKVWITSGIDTLMRNIVGTSIGMTLKAGSTMLEGIVYAAGVGVKGALTGVKTGDATKIISESYADAVGVFFNLVDTKKKNLSYQTAEEILKFNPTARDTLFKSLQETGEQDISKLGRWANTMNVAVDGVFRRAVFTDSVAKQLKDQGIDLYTDILAKNKVVPAPVIKRAMNDSLKSTFSYMPKETKKGVRNLETMGETGASMIVKLVETIPLSSLAIPFPRFMANAMAFQYRYSPAGGLFGAGGDFLTARALQKEGKEEASQVMFRQANMKFAQGVVGTSALYAAYNYRENNQGEDWFNVKLTEGGITDVRSLFPIGPYMAVADFMVKMDKGEPAKTGDMIESFLGMKLPAGTSGYFFDNIAAAMDSEKSADQLQIAIGKVVGDYVGRFSQPFVFKQAYDTIDMLREEGSLARDPNVLDEGEGGGTAAVQRIMNKLPILKEYLPEAAPRFRESENIYKEGELFNRLIGIRQMPNKSGAEKEITRLQINPYSVYGRSTGSKEFDNKIVREINKDVLPLVKELIADEEYQRATFLEKKIAMHEVIRESVSFIKGRVMDEMQWDDEKRDKYYKLQFNKLPDLTRRFINERYNKDYGMTMEEANDYQDVDWYKFELDLVKKGSFE